MDNGSGAIQLSIRGPSRFGTAASGSSPKEEHALAATGRLGLRARWGDHEPKGKDSPPASGQT
eukprot:88349-Rhodomonas_salina.4